MSNDNRYEDKFFELNQKIQKMTLFARNNPKSDYKLIAVDQSKRRTGFFDGEKYWALRGDNENDTARRWMYSNRHNYDFWIAMKPIIANMPSQTCQNSGTKCFVPKNSRSSIALAKIAGKFEFILEQLDYFQWIIDNDKKTRMSYEYYLKETDVKNCYLGEIWENTIYAYYNIQTYKISSREIKRATIIMANKILELQHPDLEPLTLEKNSSDKFKHDDEANAILLYWYSMDKFFGEVWNG